MVGGETPPEKPPGDKPRRNPPEKTPRVNPHWVILRARRQSGSHIRAKFDEAEGRGGLAFTSYDYIHHLVSGQSLGCPR